MAPRPGPLMPYPLELFTAGPGAPGTPSKHLLPHKRPFSPSLGCLNSPAKRRHARSPLSASSNSARFAPAHFQSLLQGPNSPAKKLEFGSSNSTAGGSPTGASEMTACSRSGSRPPKQSPKRASATRVRRSPRLSARVSSVLSEGPAVAECSAVQVEVESSVRVSIAAAEPILVPREVTPPDPQSIHYPGFIIYSDPHIVTPTSSSLAAPSAVAASDTAGDGSLSEQDVDKENLAPPRKRYKKASGLATPTETSSTKVAIPSPASKRAVLESAGKVKPVPASPHPKHVCDYLSAAHITPKERTTRTTSSPASTLVGVTPGRTPLGKEARKEMRKALEEEVDDFDGDDDL
ncbi:hypothetical protein BD413DRAFT_602484 [Trametes elegans]|nr:hypothetical protein BD413DRAFT_602484 [Trametes elegans]